MSLAALAEFIGVYVGVLAALQVAERMR